MPVSPHWFANSYSFETREVYKATHSCRHVSKETNSFNNVFIPTADVKKTAANKFHGTFR